MAVEGMTVQPATAADLPALAALHWAHLDYHAQFDRRYRPNAPASYESLYAEHLADPLAGVFVARFAGHAIGFATCRLHEVAEPTARWPAAKWPGAKWPGANWPWPKRRAPVTAGSATLVDLFVDPRHRRQGVGTALVAAVMAWLAAKGAREVGLGVMADNADARRFWARQGFVEYRVQMRRSVGA